MSSTNQSPQYKKAEAMFLMARKDEDRLFYLEEMIRECPKHKSAEKMLANLKTRRKKLLEKLEKSKKSGGIKKSGIKKEEMQAVIVGFTNSGKSTLLSLLTNSSPEIAPYEFTTRMPLVGAMDFQGIKIQIIEIPAIGSEYYDRNIVNNTNVILILVNDVSQIEKIEKELQKANGKRIIVFNKKFDLDERKIEATLKSKKYNFVIINTETKEGLEELKDKIFRGCDRIRVFTKEPNKGKGEKPIILPIGSTVYDVAEKIRHGFSKLIKESFVTGPSSKFPKQNVSLKHVLKDLDIVEFKVK